MLGQQQKHKNSKIIRLLHKISNDRFNKTDITLLGSIHSYCRADNLLVVVVPEPLKLYIDSSCKQQYSGLRGLHHQHSSNSCKMWTRPPNFVSIQLTLSCLLWSYYSLQRAKPEKKGKTVIVTTLWPPLPFQSIVGNRATFGEQPQSCKKQSQKYRSQSSFSGQQWLQKR